MPDGDYRDYDFRGIICSMTKFPFNSLLPEDSNFLKLIYSNFIGDTYDENLIGEDGFSLTRNVLENIHNYDLSGIEIDLDGYEDYLTESQLSLLRIKYKEELNENIFLPEKSEFKGKDAVDNKSAYDELVI